MKAVLCPVCLGKGRIPDESSPGTTSPVSKPCHGCGGRGWVEVHEDYNYPPYPHPPNWEPPCDWYTSGT